MSLRDASRSFKKIFWAAKEQEVQVDKIFLQMNTLEQGSMTPQGQRSYLPNVLGYLGLVSTGHGKVLDQLFGLQLQSEPDQDVHVDRRHDLLAFNRGSMSFCAGFKIGWFVQERPSYNSGDEDHSAVGSSLDTTFHGPD